jgi:hypothetical protein
LFLSAFSYFLTASTAHQQIESNELKLWPWQEPSGQ